MPNTGGGRDIRGDLVVALICIAGIAILAMVILIWPYWDKTLTIIVVVGVLGVAAVWGTALICGHLLTLYDRRQHTPAPAVSVEAGGRQSDMDLLRMMALYTQVIGRLGAPPAPLTDPGGTIEGHVVYGDGQQPMPVPAGADAPPPYPGTVTIPPTTNGAKANGADPYQTWRQHQQG